MAEHTLCSNCQRPISRNHCDRCISATRHVNINRNREFATFLQNIDNAVETSRNDIECLHFDMHMLYRTDALPSVVINRVLSGLTELGTDVYLDTLLRFVHVNLFIT